MVTLFTKAPTHPRGANTYLRENFGHPDPKQNNLKILHTTISALKFNTYKNKYGFKLLVSEEDEKIFIIIRDLMNDQLIYSNIYYSFNVLKDIVEKKCKHIAYIEAKTRKNNGTEEFKFTKATLLYGLTFEKFIVCINKGIIMYDIRIGVYKSGSNYGKTHDYGSGFRISKAEIEKAFSMEQL